MDPTTTNLAAVLERATNIPARGACGVSPIALEVGRSEWRMDTPTWMTDADGTIGPGTLGVLVDATLGTCVMSAVPTGWAMVTSHLQLEVLRPICPEIVTLTCVGRPTAVDEHFALSAGEVTDEHGSLVARATMGSVLFAGRPDQVAPTDAFLAVPEEPILHTELLADDGMTITTRTIAPPWLANSFGGLHGGAGFLIGGRTLDLAIRRADPGDRPMRTVDVRVSFLRPVPADGRSVESTGTVVHRGRRLGAARGELRGPDGRPALLLDATYVPI